MRGLLIFSALFLTGCGSSPRENVADRLDNAAEQSDPAAAPILENAAEEIRENGALDPNAAARDALQSAGNAQVGSDGDEQ